MQCPDKEGLAETTRAHHGFFCPSCLPASGSTSRAWRAASPNLVYLSVGWAAASWESGTSCRPLLRQSRWRSRALEVCKAVCPTMRATVPSHR